MPTADPTKNELGIEWIILADSAESLNGKLYMLGGGWNQILVRSGFPFNYQFSIAVSVTIPWIRTNEKHTLRLELVDEDGLAKLATVDGEFEMGRPAGTQPGQVQRMVIAFKFGLKFERAGTYCAVGLIDGHELNRADFHITPVPGSQPAQKPGR